MASKRRIYLQKSTEKLPPIKAPLILQKNGTYQVVRSDRGRDIQAVVLQQSKGQPDQFSGSESECTFMLVLVNLFEFKIVITPELRAATHKRIGSFTQVVSEITVTGVNKMRILCFK